MSVCANATSPTRYLYWGFRMYLGPKHWKYRYGYVVCTGNYNLSWTFDNNYIKIYKNRYTVCASIYSVTWVYKYAKSRYVVSISYFYVYMSGGGIGRWFSVLINSIYKIRSLLLPIRESRGCLISPIPGKIATVYPSSQHDKPNAPFILIYIDHPSSKHAETDISCIRGSLCIDDISFILIFIAYPRY